MLCGVREASRSYSSAYMQVERHQQTMRCLGGRLVTWYVHQSHCAKDYSECNPEVAKSIDLVATLGGDGTLLWACKTMGARSVPPVIPYAFGSLGFMTPFASSSISQVLEVRQVSSPVDSCFISAVQCAHSVVAWLQWWLRCAAQRPAPSGCCCVVLSAACLQMVSGIYHSCVVLACDTSRCSGGLGCSSNMLQQQLPQEPCMCRRWCAKGMCSCCCGTGLSARC